ncbi:MAG TPA: radical SAM family heme chaperone HemW [Candidatus Acidoferrum sp.]|nr:radical SAM family heme chaperone HemW [Candidatus Acidoferrum sp.]
MHNSRLGIYIQVPFCQTKCTYCNFHTGVVSAGRFSPYVEAVCREIRGFRELNAAAGVKLPEGFEKATVDTVYIGGGTPSLLEPGLLRRMVDAIQETFATELNEVTIEADPETVEAGKAEAWVAAAINRVSFGVQSFSDKELAAAGRMHRRRDVYRAVPILRAAGIRNISFDLIAGLPFQTRESWKDSLEQLRELEPEHVSVYLLEVDEGSRLGKEILNGGVRYSAGAVPSDDEMADFYEAACEFLGAAGYHHYEISNWGKPGLESRHNLKYWRREPYLGFGAGAHSFSGTERWANAHDAAEYGRAIMGGRLPIEQLEVVTPAAALEEELFLGLRQLDGIDVGRIEREYGVALGGRFEPLESAGLIERSGELVRLSPARLSVSNEVFVGLMR